MNPRLRHIEDLESRIKSQFQVNLQRPRHVEDSDVAYLSKEILGQLREEIDRSFNAEYSREEKR